MQPTGFPRPLIRHIENRELPLQGLDAMRELRTYLDELEPDLIRNARRLGASPTDIAKALGITRQSVYNRLRAMEQEGGPVVIPELEEERER